MRKFRIPALSGFAVLLFVCSAFSEEPKASYEEGHPGLLIISHGSPSAQWNNPVSDLVEHVRKLNADEGKFHAVEAAFLEFAQPDAASGIEKLQSAGCDRIIVVPFFIAPSGHSLFDVPAVLGLYSSPSIRRTLKDEGAMVARPIVPVTLTQTLSEGDLLDSFVMTEIEKLSKNPKDEAIVLIAHGSADQRDLHDRTMRRLVTGACGRSGISYGDWAYCEMGQSYLQEAVPAIVRAGERKKRALVIGLYVSSSSKRIHDSVLESAKEPMAAFITKPLGKMEIVLSEAGVVNHPATASWLLATAAEALENQPQTGGLHAARFPLEPFRPGSQVGTACVQGEDKELK
jgi:hypothetical protein